MKEIKKSFLIDCPSCGESFSYYTSEFRPFCSERCRMVDLGQWLREDYKVPGREEIRIDEKECFEDEE